MDQPDTNENALMEELTKRLDEKCINFSAGLETEEAKENLAVCDEAVLEHYLESGEIQKEEIHKLNSKEKSLSLLLWLSFEDSGSRRIFKRNRNLYKENVLS